MLSHDILDATPQQAQSDDQALGFHNVFTASILEGKRSSIALIMERKLRGQSVASFEKIDESKKKVERTKCCISLVEVPVAECIRCSAGHSIHASMANPYIDSEFEKDFDKIKANKGGIPCPFENCKENFQNDELEKIVSPEAFEKVLKMKKRYDEYSAYVDTLEQGKEDMESCIRQQFLKADGTFSGYACPRCNYGPIDRKACGDLTAHQHQKKGTGVRISNKCPMCFFFAPNISDWKVWDGKFLSPREIADIRKYKEKAEEDFEGKLMRQREEVSKMRAEKNSFMQKYGLHARSIMLAQIREATPVVRDEEEEIDVIDEDTEEPETIGNVQGLIRQIEDADNLIEKAKLGLQLTKALKRSKNGGASIIPKYVALSQNYKKAGSMLFTIKDKYEADVSRLMDQYVRKGQ